MNKIRDTATVPRGGKFVYINPEDGWVIAWGSFNATKAAAIKYRTINNYPIGLLFDDQFEENLCSNAAPGVCEEFIPPSLMNKAAHLAKALAKSALSGFKVVTPEVLEERKAVCRECNFFGGDKGLLRVACKKCGCGGLKLHFKSENCPIGKWKSV